MTPQEFKEARLQLHLTQEQLAVELGMSPTQICALEKGEYPVRKIHVLAMKYLAGVARRKPLQSNKNARLEAEMARAMGRPGPLDLSEGD